ncbi:hypothetical protein JQ604_29235 [Bradyrhizobium jicamae]|uniref:hypothetical protein n=1 Tax=Bradyrhizobium jicamae TaxID=280332 RepID=UPI001BA97F38|nr:hypothetical protein [Bradyrhizobium jicamae]MBR0756280.1 hypothetical protein [Bradyrhizobium jicamae]
MEAQSVTTAVAAHPSARRSLVATAMISVITLLIMTFDLLAPNWPASFGDLLLLPLTALLFLGCCLWSLVLLLWIRRGGISFAGPLVICAATAALLVTAPLQDIYLQANFRWHRAERDRIVAQVARGELTPNVDYNKNLIALGPNAPGVSEGNEIVVDGFGEGAYVLFMTYRGLKHYFNGFLYVPPGSDPAKFFEFDDKPPRRLDRCSEQWYFVAN